MLSGHRYNLTFLYVCAVAVSIGCSKSEDRAPPRESSVGTGSTTISGPGAAGSASTADVETDAPLSTEGESIMLTGAVEAFLDDRFRLSSPLTETGSVFGQSGDNSEDFSSTNYDGASYTLASVLSSSGTWFEYIPDDSLNDFATLTQLDTLAGETTLPVVPRFVIEEVMSLASTLAKPEGDKAQLILRLIDTEENELSNIEVLVPGSELGLYANGDTWSDLLNSTTTSGLFFAGNINVTAPRTQIPITLNNGDLPTRVVLLSPGSVTYVQVKIEEDAP